VDGLEVSLLGKWAVAAAIVDDVGCEGRPDTGQELQAMGVGGVDVDTHVGGLMAQRRPVGGARQNTRRHPYQQDADRTSQQPGDVRLSAAPADLTGGGADSSAVLCSKMPDSGASRAILWLVEAPLVGPSTGGLEPDMARRGHMARLT
jgi:hypothetical protein